MKRTPLTIHLVLFTAMVALSGCATDEPPPPDLEQRLEEEVARLEIALREIDRTRLPESLQTSLDSHHDSLSAIDEIESPLLRLYSLREPFVGIVSIAFLSRHSDAGRSIDDLERLWNERHDRFDITVESRGSSLQDALAEVADLKSKRLFRAGLQYGRISRPSSGLYYLAEAEGHRHYRDFVSSLDLPHEEASALDRESLIAGADMVESEALVAFDHEPTSRAMIPVNVRLDEARELIERDRLAGGMLQILEAGLQLSRNTPAPAQAGAAGTERDDGDQTTILTLIHAILEDEEQKNPGSRASNLLPLYHSMRGGTPSPRGAEEPVVTLTLVRWPYT